MEGQDVNKPKRIKQVSVINIFGTFNHVIPLNMDERITIIYGSNGFGKTIMLKLLDAFFNQNNHFLQTIPLDEFRVDFEDNTSCWISKSSHSSKRMEGKDSTKGELCWHSTGRGFYSLPVRLINSTTQQLQEIEDEICDTLKKLNNLDDLAQRINLLTTIINNRFLYKTIAIYKEKGVVFTAKNGTTLSLENLSSGEQREFILFYELLFRVTPGSLILIDEPESSLHIVWQEQFLKDLQQVVQLIDSDIILATHSPDIISNRRDLVIKLEEPQNARL